VGSRAGVGDLYQRQTLRETQKGTKSRTRLLQYRFRVEGVLEWVDVVCGDTIGNWQIYLGRG